MDYIYFHINRAAGVVYWCPSSEVTDDMPTNIHFSFVHRWVIPRPTGTDEQVLKSAAKAVLNYAPPGSQLSRATYKDILNQPIGPTTYDYYNSCFTVYLEKGNK